MHISSTPRRDMAQIGNLPYTAPQEPEKICQCCQNHPQLARVRGDASGGLVPIV